MLPHYYKLHVLNNSGQTLDFSTNSANEKAKATIRRWKFDSTGAITWEGSEGTLVTAATDLADGASEEGSNIDNSSDKYLGGEGYFRVETDNASAAGDVSLMLEASTDGGTTFPSDEADYDPDVHLVHVATITLGGAEAKGVSFSL